MSQKEFISGSILQFKVPLDLGYGYCKILDFRYIREFDGVLAKVYDHVVEEPITDISILKEKDWLFGARRMAWLPNTRGKGAWKFKGVLIAEDDKIIPDFKYSYQASPLIEDESTIKEWYVIRNIKESSDAPCTHEQVKHLENTVVNTQIGIEIRTAMEFCRRNNLDIKKYFDLKDLANWNNYRTMINVPIYNTIPKEIRGKALC
ncbi:MAG TPA: Imm26 family immunity protein [Chitinophagaceae bacterium]|nr:Imm26 family immunity protein [Chitinophagaceae bacterium]